ncbi:MAG: hypothetical protein AB1508_13775 [Pseudomonadota bacterium]
MDTRGETADGSLPGAPLPIWQQTATRFGWGTLVDGVLGGTGCVAAVVCAGFAVYMTAHPSPTFNGIEHLMIFAQPNYEEPPAVAEASPPADRKGIDYSATGTIRVPDMPPVSRIEPIVRAYTLHYVHQGEALIIGNDDAVYRVALGSIVPGVGRVLAIEERHGQWVVVTQRGLIVAR